MAMTFAQKLFEGIDLGGVHKALITYIRTDSADIAEEFLPVLENHIKSTYGEEYYAPMKKQKKGVNAQEGHECIRVVDLSMTTEELSKYIADTKLLKVYDLIYKRTVAALMSPVKISKTTYDIVCNNHVFTMSSQEIIFDGYKKVYSYDDEKDSDEEDTFCKVTFDKQEKLNDTSLELAEKETTPPPRYKEATFIKALETTGIGRPSTYATILNTLLDSVRGYCTIQDKCIIPTQKGIELSHYLTENFSDLINVKYTEELEKSLDIIAQGKLTQEDFLSSFYQNLETSVKQANKKSVSIESSDKVIREEPCPNCGNKMILRKGPFGEFWGCSNYPKCKTTVGK